MAVIQVIPDRTQQGFTIAMARMDILCIRLSLQGNHLLQVIARVSSITLSLSCMGWNHASKLVHWSKHHGRRILLVLINWGKTSYSIISPAVDKLTDAWACSWAVVIAIGMKVSNLIVASLVTIRTIDLEAASVTRPVPIKVKGFGFISRSH